MFGEMGVVTTPAAGSQSPFCEGVVPARMIRPAALRGAGPAGPAPRRPPPRPPPPARPPPPCRPSGTPTCTPPGGGCCGACANNQPDATNTAAATIPNLQLPTPKHRVLIGSWGLGVGSLRDNGTTPIYVLVLADHESNRVV